MPLYTLMEKLYHQRVCLAAEEFAAGIATPRETGLLGLSGTSPVLRLTRTSYNEKNETIEYTLSTVRADEFKYRMMHYQR